MNGFFKKKHLIFLSIAGAVFAIYVISSFVKLSRQTPEEFYIVIPPEERGSIADRTGKLLAVQTNFYSMGVTRENIKDPSQFASCVAEVLEMNPVEIISILNAHNGVGFAYIKKKIDLPTYKELKKIIDSSGYTFVSFDKIPGRVYPEHSLAAQVIGYMGDDGKGLAGVEYTMQNQLQPPSSDDNDSSQSGNNVYLTIDANLQYKLEQVAKETMETTQAESMMILTADAKTGELLSYISFPSVDLNEYNKATAMQTIDRPAMVAYEPGSVFKIFTIAMLYDAGLLRKTDTFVCDGIYEKMMKSGEKIRIRCLDHHGRITAEQALQYSCNDVLAQISDRAESDEAFMASIKRLGFGQKTGIELPGETIGSVKDPSNRLWSARSRPTIAIGQEISVSALQMLQAAMAIANLGVPLQPSIIKKITDKDGNIIYEHKAELKERLFSESTAKYVLNCMETTATKGTGAKAHLNDISIGVKTGTAQMTDKNTGRYSDTDFVSNCMAVFPVENPQIVLYIVVQKAKGETYAGRIVAPVIKKAADIIIDHLGMSRGDAASFEHDGRITIDSHKEMAIGKTVPDFTGKSKRDLLPLTKRTDIQLKINGYGWVTSQSPSPGTPVTENMIIELNLE